MPIDYNVKQDGLYISKKEWARAQSFSIDHVIDFISDIIDKHAIPIPYRPISELEAWADFLELCKLNTATLLNNDKFTTRYNYKKNLSDQYIKSSKIGNIASDYFHQEQRYRCDSINGPGPYRSWTDKKLRRVLLKSLWRLRVKEITPSILRKCMALSRNIASQFRPSAAKTIYDMFSAEKVLDFSAGWGDRLCAFHACSSTEYYLGVDPNTDLIDNYLKQNDFYDTGKTAEFINFPAEELDYLKNEFDLIFTSPPYFNIEKYDKSHLQSYKRYKKLREWLESFLFQTISKTWSSLKKGGHLVLNISDVYSNHQVHHICDPMCDFIGHNLSNARFIKCLGMQLGKRPNTGLPGNGIFAEPIWIWKKY